MSPDIVRQLIRRRIEDGRLPLARTIELWHGPGLGQTCDGCGLPIVMADVMSLLCTDDWRAIHFHKDCFLVWTAEKQLRDRRSNSSFT
jgi:hypothetical protein